MLKTVSKQIITVKTVAGICLTKKRVFIKPRPNFI